MFPNPGCPISSPCTDRHRIPPPSVLPKSHSANVIRSARPPDPATVQALSKMNWVLSTAVPAFGWLMLVTLRKVMASRFFPDPLLSVSDHAGTDRTLLVGSG